MDQLLDLIQRPGSFGIFFGKGKGLKDVKMF